MVTQDILFETVDAKILAVQGSDQSLDFEGLQISIRHVHMRLRRHRTAVEY